MGISPLNPPKGETGQMPSEFPEGGDWKWVLNFEKQRKINKNNKPALGRWNRCPLSPEGGDGKWVLNFEE